MAARVPLNLALMGVLIGTAVVFVNADDLTNCPWLTPGDPTCIRYIDCQDSGTVLRIWEDCPKDKDLFTVTDPPVDLADDWSDCPYGYGDTTVYLKEKLDAEGSVDLKSCDFSAAGPKLYFVANDVNEFPPYPAKDTLPVMEVEVNENTSPYEIATIYYSDDDDGETANLEAVLISAEYASTFALDAGPVDTTNNWKSFSLKTLSELDYEDRPFYKVEFNIKSTDERGGENTTAQTFFVYVGDEPDMAPYWSEIRPFYELNECKAEDDLFFVEAQDRDIMVGYTIGYSFEEESEYFKIDKDTGWVSKKKDIDREELLENGTSSFTLVIVATEYKSEGVEGEEPNSNEQVTVITITDCNDEFPTFNNETYEIEMDEVTSAGNQVLDLSIVVKDMDEGDSGAFKLETDKPDQITISPKEGKQTQEVTLTALYKNEDSLFDYENQRNVPFEIQITATEVRDPSHTDTATVTIKLRDVNDEAPVFSQSVYSANVKEGTSLNTSVLKVEADDGDVSPEFGKPSIRYSLESPCNEFDVDPVSGDVRLAAVLDFEGPEGINNLIKCTVIARDEGGDGFSNKDPTTIAITVLDVVDEPPRFENSDVDMEIPENSNEDTDVGIFTVIDEDADASVIFEIIDFICSDGTGSANVTGWFKVTAQPKDPPNYSAKLQVGKETIDREACKEVTLTIQATDRNTIPEYEAEKSVTENFIIIIVDENDEDPKVDCEGDCDDISVNEINELKPNTASVVVFRVMVSDPDKEDTISLALSDTGDVMYLSKETVTVQEGNAELVEVRTKEGAMIDREKQATIDFDILATDSENHFTTKSISVKINDLNDKKPVITTDLCGNGVIDIEEDDGSGKINGTFIVQIQAEDDDVESPYNKAMYMMMNDQSSSSQDMSVPFTIDPVTGNVTVLLIAGRKDLDREEYSTWELRFRAYDECDGSLTCTVQQSETECIVTINVTDVNDHAPEDLTWQPDELIEVTEFLRKDEDIGYRFSATDEDEGINSTITYSVLGTYLLGSDEDEGLFRAENEAFIDSSCRLYANEDFEGQKLRGVYNVILEAKDGGNKTTDFNITIYVNDANDEAPSFVFEGCLGETEDNVIRMVENAYLPGENGDPKMEVRCSAPDGPPFKIKFEDADEDLANIKSHVKIDMENSTVDDVDDGVSEQTLLSYWSLEPEGCEVDCRLYITHKIDREEGNVYNLSLYIQNTATPKKENWARVRVLVTNEWEYDPFFCRNGNCSQVVYMYENDPDVAAPFDNAIDDDNNGTSFGDIDYNIVYYYIVGGDEQYFQIKNEIVSTITLKDMPDGLDREERSEYSLKIIATNDIGAPGVDNGDSPRNDTLNLIIRVGDVNDESPSFSDDVLFTSFMESNNNNDPISTIEAIDLDLNETLTYEMLDDLQWFQTDIMPEAPFRLEKKDSRSVYLTLNIDPTGLTRGYCNFTITVEDLYGHTDRTTVKVYIINEDHQVAMYFSNEVDEIKSQKKTIEDIYSSVYEYACTIDSIASTQSSTGETISNKTTVYMHFIDEEKNEPVDDKIILDLSDNVQLMTTLVDRLNVIGIHLDSVDTFMPSTNDKNPEEKIRELQILLGVVSLVLGLLVLLLATVYWLRTNKLERKIKVLSTNTFGSKDGGLDQIGLDIASVPGSNYLAKEHGNHNPVFSESGGSEFRNQDAESISSGDSVLVGVEDNPEFKSYFAKGTPVDSSKGFENPSYIRSIDDVSAAPPGVQGGMKGNPLLNLAASKDEPRLSSASQGTDYDGDSLQSQDAAASVDENIKSNFSFS